MQFQQRHDGAAGHVQGGSTHTYDEENRLTRITGVNQTTGVNEHKSEFFYDGQSRKVISREFTWNSGTGQWVQQSETRRVYDGMDVVQERDGSNAVTANYTRSGNIGGLLARTTSAGHFYYHYDGGGNVMQLTDSTQATVAQYSYDAYGVLISAGGLQSGQPYRFSTKEYHSASGLYDYGYRFYSPNLGRWLNRDPLKEGGGLNLYGFVGNNPINKVDAYGLHAIDISLYPPAKDGTISVHIYVNLAFEGPGVTQALKDQWEKGIEGTWSGRFGKYRVYMNVDTDPTQGIGYHWGVITVPNEEMGTAPQDRSHTNGIGSDYGKWYIDTSGRGAAHEVGHMMGLPDRYDAWDLDKDGNELEPKDPKDKWWDKNIMGIGRLPSQADIAKIIAYPGNNVRPKK